MTIGEAYKKLTPFVAPIMNVKKGAERAMQDYEMRKHIGVHAYFEELIAGKGAMVASQIAAKIAWIVPSEHYRAMAIRSYAKEYLRFGKISPHQQGKHTKRLSLLNGQQHTQNFYILEVNNRQTKKGLKEERVWKLKGLRTILEERGLGRWEEFEAEKKHWKTNCGENANTDNTCCPHHMLAAQPDFVAQKTALHETVHKAGHLFALYPKYHCETNWIERYWGAAKRIARKECNYTYAALSNNLDGYLDQISPPNSVPLEIRRYYNRCWRYIRAYNDMKNVTEAFKLVEKFTSRRYRSHRRIGIND